MKGDTVSYKSK